MDSSHPPAGFKPIDHGLSTRHMVAKDHKATLLIGWGDGLYGTPPASFPLTEAEQGKAFGYNNDFIAYPPLHGNRHGLLGVNHAYPSSHLMLPGLSTEARAMAILTRDQIRPEHGRHKTHVSSR